MNTALIKRVCQLWLLCLIPACAPAQSVRDSLEAAYAAATSDTTKLIAAVGITDELTEGEWDIMKSWLDSVETIAARYPMHHYSVEWAFCKANWLRNTNNWEAAYALAMDCARRFNALGNIRRQSDALGEAGIALTAFNPEQAIAVLEESVRLARESKDSMSTAINLISLANALDLTGRELNPHYKNTLDSALHLFRSADFPIGIIVTNDHLVNYYCQVNELDKARAHIAENKAILAGEEESAMHAYPFEEEALVLKAAGKYREALAMAEISWQILKKYGDLDGQNESYPLLIELYEKTGDYTSAYRQFKNYQAMKDSALSAEKNRTVQNLQTYYETAKKEARIERQEQDLARANREQWGLIVGLCILGILVLLFWRQRQKTKAANRDLALRNEQVKLQNEKLDLILRELHHRVKNNLQIISSLLRLQSRRLNDEPAATAIRAGQMRVEAMSLIHQSLYRQEGITLVDMETLIRDLAEKITFAFSADAQDVALYIDVNPKELDVDKAMPLSLIINELLTNSFKYAFPGHPGPQLRITLLQTAASLRLQYADNGPGCAETPPAAAEREGFGSQLIRSLSKQLGGEARSWNERGAHFELIFPA